MKWTTLTLFASAASVTPAMNSDPQARPTWEVNTPIVFRSEAEEGTDDINDMLLGQSEDYISEFF
jgi:hypothetical protein